MAFRALIIGTGFGGRRVSSGRNGQGGAGNRAARMGERMKQGFAEFRGPTLLQPLIGNAVVTAGYLLTGSPLAAILAHVIMHGAAVFQGMEGTVQLPPHY